MLTLICSMRYLKALILGENPRASQRGQGGVSRGEQVLHRGLSTLLLTLLVAVVALVHRNTFVVVHQWKPHVSPPPRPAQQINNSQ